MHCGCVDVISSGKTQPRHSHVSRLRGLSEPEMERAQWRQPVERENTITPAITGQIKEFFKRKCSLALPHTGSSG